MIGKVRYTPSGSVEVREYRVPILCDTGGEGSKKGFKKPSDDSQKRADNLFRARALIRDIIWANEGEYTKFVTLTYAKPCLDVDKCRNDIKNFNRSMRRMGYDMRYLYVLEHQRKRGEKEGNEGSLHVHMVLFVDQKVFLDDLRKAWPHCPHPDVKQVRKIKNLGAYVCKYLTKDNLAEFGRRSFNCSVGLDRPREVRYYNEGFSDVGNSSLPAYKDQIDVSFFREKCSEYRALDGNIVWQKMRVTVGSCPLDPDTFDFLEECRHDTSRADALRLHSPEVLAAGERFAASAEQCSAAEGGSSGSSGNHPCTDENSDV